MTARSATRDRARARRRAKRGRTAEAAQASAEERAEAARARSIRRAEKAAQTAAYERERTATTANARTTTKDSAMPTTETTNRQPTQWREPKFGQRPDRHALAAERGVLASLAASRRGVAQAEAVPCERHDAPAGEPCFTTPRGVCGPRLTLAITVRARY
jgi:hypothetical protein